MYRRNLRQVLTAALAIAFSILLVPPVPTFAGVGGGDVPTVTSPISIGQTGLPWSFTITNLSTTPNDTDSVQVLHNNISFTTTCGIPSPDGVCPSGSQEASNTITISPLTATGQAGTACAGVSFTVAATGNPNEYVFTPGANVILGPSNVGGNAARCQVNFTVNVNARPVHDSSANTGLQTSQLARVETLRDTTTQETGSCAGTSTVTVNIFSPTIVTTPNPTSGLVGTVLYDSATLAGGGGPNGGMTGTVTFKLFGVNDQTCGAAPIFTNIVPVSGNGTYNTSAGFITVAPGTYHWIASYSGDLYNDPVSSICANEAVLITAPQLTINTTPNPGSGVVGTVLNDCAVLAGGVSPTGTITFRLFGVNDQTCSAAPIFTNTVSVSGAGTYCTTAGFTTVEVGTYHWLASYSGDANNSPLSDLCANEPVVIGGPPPGEEGESPYIGIVGNDIAFNPFYFSPKHQQFLYDQTLFDVPVCFGTVPPVVPQTRVGGPGCEQFRSNTPMNQPEICDTTGLVNGVGDFTFYGEPNAVIRKDNAGYFEWYIRLPKKPNGQINLVFQCGVLKPNTFLFEEFDAVKVCAAETGERIGTGFCTSNQVRPNVNPIISSSLPVIIAAAYPGPYSLGFSPFNLTAYKNPGTYDLATDTRGMFNNASLQVLDGSTNARVMLKACLDKTVIVKIPVTGQVNALGQTEADLEAGDLIYVRMNVPGNNKVDIYCNPQSLRLAGIAEGPY